MDGFRTAPWWDSDTEAICCILARHLTVRGLIIESVSQCLLLGWVISAVMWVCCLTDYFYTQPGVQISRPGQRKSITEKVSWLLLLSTAMFLTSAVHDVETHQAHLRSIWMVEKTPYNSSNHLWWADAKQMRIAAGTGASQQRCPSLSLNAR